MVIASTDEKARIGYLGRPLSSFFVHPKMAEALKSRAAGILALSGIGFECHLGRPAAPVDLALRVFSEEKEPFVQRVKGYAHPGIESFFTQWNNPICEKFRSVEAVWVEFDFRIDYVPIEIPSLFFSLVDTERTPLPILISHLFEATHQESLPPTILTKSLESVSSIPAHAYVRHIGLMLSRKSKKIRFCIKGLTLDQMFDYLDRMNESGISWGLLPLVLNDLAPHLSETVLDIDIGEQMDPKIGIECYAKESNCRSLLQKMVDLELCSQNEKNELLCWPGEHQLEGLRTLRIISHIKIVYAPQQPLAVKAYLYAGQSPSIQQRSSAPYTSAKGLSPLQTHLGCKGDI